MRINGFHQITAFYSIVFGQKYDFRPQHISLYVFLLNQNNRNNWVEWFKCPIDLGMTGSCIGSKKTYYSCLDDLQSWGLLKYEKGENMWKAPKIRLEVLKQTTNYTSTVPQSEPLPIPHEHLNLHPYINLQPTTNNNKNNTDANAVFESFRILFPGRKRGLETELKTFQKHKDWKTELPKLEKAIQSEIIQRQEKKKAGGFVPEWPMLSTYLNQRRWEAEPETLAQTISTAPQQIPTPDLPNYMRGIEYSRSGYPNRIFKGNYNEYMDAVGCTPNEEFTIVREYVIQYP